jgi:hypothetical protein
MYNMVMYYYVLIVFSLHRESLMLILATDPFRCGSVTLQHLSLLEHSKGQTKEIVQSQISPFM